MTQHSTWRDFCKHYGSCEIGPRDGRCFTPDDPSYIADMERRYPPRRVNHAYWASVCTCGLAEQERTGHYPEHERWCDLPSPLDEEE